MSEAGGSDRARAINNFRITAESWKKKSVALGSVHLMLGITAILLSTAVASKPPFLGNNPDVFSNLAYFSAATTAILTFLSAKEGAARHTIAFRTLQEMIDRDDADKTYNFDNVAQAMRTGVAIIDTSQGFVGRSPPRPNAK